MPDEYRVDEHLKNYVQSLIIPSKVFDTEHFYSTRNELGNLFEGKKTTNANKLYYIDNNGYDPCK